ncbi:MAG: hypothetical protein CL912_23525 [Deltaproteobacteria bacterium]|nr:hypothetical protein [Deltaproteobacteria bacterium]
MKGNHVHDFVRDSDFDAWSLRCILDDRELFGRVKPRDDCSIPRANGKNNHFDYSAVFRLLYCRRRFEADPDESGSKLVDEALEKSSAEGFLNSKS